MAKSVYYRQCKLQRGNSFMTSYIPEQFAVKDKFLKLYENEVWVDGWKVIEVSSFRMEDKDTLDSHDAIKHHRKATGDSMPKEKK